jgi:hypothetical protein
MRARRGPDRQAIFDHLIGSGPLRHSEPELLAFYADLIAVEVDALAARIRWRTGRTTEADHRDHAVYEYVDLPDGTTRVSTRPDAVRVLAMRAAAPVIKPGRGRPATSADRWPLIRQVYHCYPARSIRLSSARASHFERTVRLALEQAGDVIADVRAECRAALAELRKSPTSCASVSTPAPSRR